MTSKTSTTEGREKMEIQTVSFKTTAHEAAVIRKIAARARALEITHGAVSPRGVIDWTMDITATHSNGNPLRLDALLEADDFNFVHDVFGICRHLDRDTGKLTGWFSPRFSVPEKAKADSCHEDLVA